MKTDKKHEEKREEFNRLCEEDTEKRRQKMRFMQFQSGKDWFTIEEIRENHFDVKRQGNSDYEQYETDEEGMERLKATATGDII